MARHTDAGLVAGMRARAVAFDVSEVTKRYMHTHEVPLETAELHAAECKRYLLLCALFPGEGLGMKGPVDDYWHLFLLFTRDYARFCRDVAGFFIHHVPNTSGQTVRAGGFDRTMHFYREVFGCEPDRRAWPHAAGGSSDTDCADGPGTDDCSPDKDCGGGGESCGSSA